MIDLLYLTCLHGVHSDKFTFTSSDEFQVSKAGKITCCDIIWRMESEAHRRLYWWW